MVPDSSPAGAPAADKPAVGGAAPPRGVFFYAVVRKEMSGGALLSQFGHAILGAAVRAALADVWVRLAVLEERERMVILGATKEQLATALAGLKDTGVPLYEMKETEGPLAGVTTAFALATSDRDALTPFLGELKPWREPKASSGQREGRHPTRHFIVLYGKRIPSHPAMTRYLVAHEYGHVVEDVLAAKLYKSNPPDVELLKAYAEARGLKAPAYYGPGQWHASPGEVFANDFRIIVCGVEPEYWPHPGIAHPNDCPAAKSWWSVFAPKAAT